LATQRKLGNSAQTCQLSAKVFVKEINVRNTGSELEAIKSPAPNRPDLSANAELVDNIIKIITITKN
jgi:hypothetical protein